MWIYSIGRHDDKDFCYAKDPLFKKFRLKLSNTSFRWKGLKLILYTVDGTFEMLSGLLIFLSLLTCSFSCTSFGTIARFLYFGG